MSDTIIEAARAAYPELPVEDEQRPAQMWALVEMMGHRRLWGRVSETVLGGAAILRVDVPLDAERFRTQFVGGAAIYSLTVMSEEACRLGAARAGAEEMPVSEWCLPDHVRAALRQRAIEYECDDEEKPF